MTEIDLDKQDHQFFDILYQQWSQTTGAEKSYWMPERRTQLGTDGGKSTWFDIVAVNANDDSREIVAQGLSESDADFICGLHGAIPDLIRRLHDTVDEAVRKDEANDEAQGALAETLLENLELRSQLHDLEIEYAQLQKWGPDEQ
jgi:hypothetical protein